MKGGREGAVKVRWWRGGRALGVVEAERGGEW
ncbi:hypothetical protein SAMN06265355_13148 [Actinomadura mexicana]|uniref:Uncharacterized protein n=1 Tax=Actinomadura mexicana TaxID=134959 RepID=A0A239HJB9_9ACTN|nr:hypothetical protein SAMN06265355_13148 [Actinomadura mexicana]